MTYHSLPYRSAFAGAFTYSFHIKNLYTQLLPLLQFDRLKYVSRLGEIEIVRTEVL